MESGCGSGGAVLYVPLESVKSWNTLGVSRLLGRTAVAQALAIGTNTGATAILPSRSLSAAQL